MKSTIWRSVLAVAAFSTAGFAVAETLTPVFRSGVTIRNGTSTLPIQLQSPMTSDRIRVSYQVTNQCPQSPSVNIQVHDLDTGRWIETGQDQNNDYVWAGGRFDQIRMNFTSRYIFAITCVYTVSVAEGGGVDPGEQEQLVGALNYGGGFAQHIPFDLNQPAIVKAIRISIPSFCQGTDILEVGTISEGVYDVATVSASNPTVFLVNGGSGLRISQILVTLNGPENQACNLPVYVQ